jgi:uroporphyrinogen decarboxylase
MGYEKLCYALFDQRDLVKAICDKVLEYSKAAMKDMLEYSRVKVIWGSDDMGFRSGTMMSPADLREFIFPHHKLMADMSHKAGRPYLIHSCGQLSEVMDDLINDVGIDGKHSFEDTIENVIETKKWYGKRIALIGGIDIDFLCRADETQVRNRVRQTLETCMSGGGYCLGTGNSVANYVPVENYLAMLDEGRKFKSA